jgi:hypothetical protein
VSNIQIHWSGLVKVAEVSLVFGLGVVAAFTLGVLALSRVETAPAGSVQRRAGLATAAVAFACCAAAVLYGLYLLIPQFH